MTITPKWIGLLVVGSLLFAACSPNSFSSQRESIPITGAESAPSAQQEQLDTIKEDNLSTLSCYDAEAFILQADHTLTVNQPDTRLTHILKQNGIALIRSSTGDFREYTLSTISPQALGYEVIGTVGECILEAAGIMLFSAQGYCQDGIVYLTITEDWQPGGGTMTCDNTSIPFEIPGYTANHQGPYNMGEEFLILDGAEGYTIVREFQGGEGYHSWTLLTDLATVPLVPDTN
jgi:hypothetical protein